MFRGFLILSAAALLLAACAANDPPKQSCPQPATHSLRVMKWGYYPGYGCGPVPPAETHFS